MTGGKLVAKVLKSAPTEYVLSYPASLTFPIEALDAGQRFAVKAALMGLVGVHDHYFLPTTAVRGYVQCNDPWLIDVYGRFVKRAMNDEFRLNPYAKPEVVRLMQGNGDAEAETVDVTVIHADKPAPTTEVKDG